MGCDQTKEEEKFYDYEEGYLSENSAKEKDKEKAIFSKLTKDYYYWVWTLNSFKEDPDSYKKTIWKPFPIDITLKIENSFLKDEKNFTLKNFSSTKKFIIDFEKKNLFLYSLTKTQHFEKQTKERDSINIDNKNTMNDLINEIIQLHVKRVKVKIELPKKPEEPLTSKISETETDKENQKDQIEITENNNHNLDTDTNKIKKLENNENNGASEEIKVLEETPEKEKVILDEYSISEKDINLFTNENLNLFSRRLNFGKNKCNSISFSSQANGMSNLNLLENINQKKNKVFEMIESQFNKNSNTNILYLSEIFCRIYLFGIFDIPLFLNPEYIKFVKLRIPRNIYTLNELKEYLIIELEREFKSLQNYQSINFFKF